MAVLKDILDAQTLTPNNSFLEIETEQQYIWSSCLLDGGNEKFGGTSKGKFFRIYDEAFKAIIIKEE